MCLRALLLRADSEGLINLYLKTGDGEQMPPIERNELVQLMREECRDDERFTIDQLNGIVEMLDTLWMKDDSASEDLEYAQAPSIYNGLLHFVDKGTLRVKDNSCVTCHWEDLLRWHTLSSVIGEDLLVCAYLASYDLKNVQTTSKRNDFAWPSYIRTDDPTLEAMLEMPLADIHAHLKGSSLNFDINWICLMNHIDGRMKQFEELAEFAQGSHRGRSTAKRLYRKASEAAAIRLFLANVIDYPIKELNGLLKKNDENAVLDEVDNLQQIIGTALINSGKTYYNDITGESAQFDYAIREGVTVPQGMQEACAYSLLSGERHILYNTLSGIYNGTYNDGRIATLLHAYLLIKNEIRHEISQLNNSTGFTNFSIYEERKLIFAKPQEYRAYKKAAIHLAVASFFNESPSNSRYHETRITPELNDEGKYNVVEKNIAEIDFNDKAVEDRMFKTRRDANDVVWPYRYIYHFIKQPDNRKDALDVVPRHEKLRKQVKEQAKGIYELRNSLQTNSSGVYYADRVVGIDAANSEIACRPEVFAQAFRYLRRHQIKRKQERCPADLGITYHVGEDFMDVIDGLRAVDEAIHFLQLQKGDRIGHGLVLGVEVGDYYELRNYTVVLSLQMQMDNAAWLWDKLTRVRGYDKTKEELKRRYGECFRKVYTHYGGTPDIDLYYSSMLLRGDNPECYDNTGNVKYRIGDADEWWNKSLVRSKVCDEARKQREACKLYHLYHYDKEGKQNGNIYDTWEVDREMCKAIEVVQHKLLQEVEDIGIAIECNPTSNRKIGEFDRYDEHPILKFNNDGLDLYPKRAISVSINTDDKGVFATSIEREYALVAHSLIRRFRLKNESSRVGDVYGWLDNIRLLSIGQRFDKSIHLDDPSEKNSLPVLKKRLCKEHEEEIKSRSLVERLKYCWNIIFVKKEK